MSSITCRGGGCSALSVNDSDLCLHHNRIEAAAQEREACAAGAAQEADRADKLNAALDEKMSELSNLRAAYDEVCRQRDAVTAQERVKWEVLAMHHENGGCPVHYSAPKCEEAPKHLCEAMWNDNGECDPQCPAYTCATCGGTRWVGVWASKHPCPDCTPKPDGTLSKEDAEAYAQLRQQLFKPDARELVLKALHDLQESINLDQIVQFDDGDTTVGAILIRAIAALTEVKCVVSGCTVPVPHDHHS